MKTYVVRQQFRTAVQGKVSYSAAGTWITGKVWDLSPTGWRTTTPCPLSTGLETIVFLALGEGEHILHFLIESAIVRWSDDCHAGWEILRVGAVSQACFAEILEPCEPSEVTSEALLLPA